MSAGLGQDLSTVAPGRTPTRVPEHGPPGLVVEGVGKHWGSTTILDGIDLSLAPGTVTWISGGNGAGKTTLLRIAAGLIIPDQGTVSIDGVRADTDRRIYQSRIGFLAAGNSGLYARLSVRRNLEFWSGLAFIPPAKRRESVGRALERFALTELQSRRADRLSLGQRQRVRLALTFLHEPRVALLDEPSANLDDEGLVTLLAAIGDHTRRGGTSVWCAPTRQTQLDCHSAYLLRDGRLEPA
jgi:ABC-2 type transport system ATP-binding protein